MGIVCCARCGFTGHVAVDCPRLPFYKKDKKTLENKQAKKPLEKDSRREAQSTATKPRQDIRSRSDTASRSTGTPTVMATKLRQDIDSRSDTSSLASRSTGTSTVTAVSLATAVTLSDLEEREVKRIKKKL